MKSNRCTGSCQVLLPTRAGTWPAASVRRRLGSAVHRMALNGDLLTFPKGQ